MTTTEDTMTIREMCDTFEVTPRTLRFYEAKELLSPIRQGQKRLFTHRDRTRLTLILKGKRYGFSLEEIRQLLDLYNRDDNTAQMQRGVEMGRQHLAEMERQRAELDSAITALRNEIAEAEHRLKHGENGAAA